MSSIRELEVVLEQELVEGALPYIGIHLDLWQALLGAISWPGFIRLMSIQLERI